MFRSNMCETQPPFHSLIHTIWKKNSTEYSSMKLDLKILANVLCKKKVPMNLTSILQGDKNQDWIHVDVLAFRLKHNQIKILD